MTGSYRTQVVTSAGELTALAADWTALYRAAPRATPFQTHAWLSSWWAAYGGPRGRLRVALVRDGAGRLVAAAPLHLRRRGPARVLAPLGGAITDFTDVLVAEDDVPDGELPAVLGALQDCLLGIRGWDVLDLPEVREPSAADLLAAAWPGPRWTFESSTCMELRVGGFDDLLKRMSGKRAGEARRRLRRADALGLVAAEVPPGEVEQGVADLIRLHTQQWESRGVTPEHVRPRFTAHLQGALAGMVADGSAALTCFSLDGEPVLASLDLVGHDMVCGYLLGVTPGLYEKIDVTTFVLRHELEELSRAGKSTFNMLRGRESYKDRWKPVVVPNRRLLLGRPRAPLAAVHAAAVRGRARVVALSRSRAPWLREAYDRVNAVRAAVRRPRG
ncbi:GNAT family N-acetyltransferase [Blastococcus sp. SYSU D00669]